MRVEPIRRHAKQEVYRPHATVERDADGRAAASAIGEAAVVKAAALERDTHAVDVRRVAHVGRDGQQGARVEPLRREPHGAHAEEHSHATVVDETRAIDEEGAATDVGPTERPGGAHAWRRRLVEAKVDRQRPLSAAIGTDVQQGSLRLEAHLAGYRRRRAAQRRRVHVGRGHPVEAEAADECTPAEADALEAHRRAAADRASGWDSGDESHSAQVEVELKIGARIEQRASGLIAARPEG